jgi:hypothetical protein
MIQVGQTIRVGSRYGTVAKIDHYGQAHVDLEETETHAAIRIRVNSWSPLIDAREHPRDTILSFLI